jgi:hypothetical protein
VTSDEDDSSEDLARLGAISVLLGALSILRLALEIYQTRTMPSGPGYSAYMAYDFVQAFTACLSGAALLRRHRWAIPVSTVAAAALFLTSVVVLVEHGRTQLELPFVLGLNENAGMWSAFGSRVFIMMLHAVYWPIVAGLVYIDLQSRIPADPETGREKRRFWICLAATLAVCGAVEIFFRLVYPRESSNRHDGRPGLQPHRGSTSSWLSSGRGWCSSCGTLCPSLGRLALFNRPDHRFGRGTLSIFSGGQLPASSARDPHSAIAGGAIYANALFDSS